MRNMCSLVKNWSITIKETNQGGELRIRSTRDFMLWAPFTA